MNEELKNNQLGERPARLASESVAGGWLSMTEAALLTPYSSEYLSLLARKGRLTAKKVDNIWFTTKPILEAYLKEQAMRAKVTQSKVETYAAEPVKASVAGALPRTRKPVSKFATVLFTISLLIIIGLVANRIISLKDGYANASSALLSSVEAELDSILDYWKDLFVWQSPSDGDSSPDASAVAPPVNTFDQESFKNDLLDGIKDLIRGEESSSSPVVVYQNGVVQPIVAERVVQTIYRDFHRQSDSNVNLMSSSLSELEESILVGAAFTTPTLTGATILGDSTFKGLLASTTELLFTTATGTSATSTNLFSTNASFKTLNLAQLSNGSTILQASRITDTLSSGDFISYWNAAGDTQLFRVDNSGNIYAGGIANSGAITITSVTTPQLRVQYDASNEITTAISSTGTITQGIIGTTPRAIWMPSSNSTSTYQFQNAAGTSALTIDTTNLGITTVNSTSTNATSTSLYVSGQTILAGAGGNVGIGATDPLAPLHIKNDQSRSALTGTGLGVLFLNGGQDHTGGDVTAMTFTENGGDQPAAIIGNQLTSNGGNLFFGTSNNFSSGITNTAMYINYAGNVGIGTTTPATNLQVYGNAEALRLGTNSNNGSYIGFQHNTTTGIPRAQAGYSTTVYGSDVGFAYLQGGLTKGLGLMVNDNSTPSLYITSGGKVGIGTTTPNSSLEVDTVQSTGSSIGNGIRVMESTGGYGVNMGAGTNYGWIQGLRGFGSTDSTNSLALNPIGGNVGIGTTTPLTPLSVVRSSGQIAGFNASTANTGHVAVTDSAGASVGMGIGTDTETHGFLGTISNTPLRIRTNNTARISVDTSGKVGIGATPRSNLEVYVGLPTSVPTGTGNTGLTVTDGSSIYGRMGVINTFATNGHYPTYIQGGLIDTSTYYNLLLEPNGGNVGIGSTNPLAKLQVNYNGVESTSVKMVGGGGSTNGNMIFGKITDYSDSFPIFAFTTAHADNARANDLFRIHSGETSSGAYALRVTTGGTIASPTRNSLIVAADTGNVGLGTAPGNYRVVGVDDSNAAKFGTLTTGRSGGEYPSTGYAVRFTGTPNSYTYDVSDYAAMIRYGTTGKIETFTASSGTAGNAISFTAGPYVALAGTSWTSSSDVRLKENIETLPVLDRLGDYRAVSFNWRQGGKHDIGVIAQELVEIFPEVVVTTNVEGEYWGVNYDKLGALALQAAKELNEKVRVIELDLASASTSLIVSTTTPGLLTSVYEAIGATYENAILYIKTLLVDRLIAKSGVVIYDRVTGEPVCSVFENGSPKYYPGDCSNLPSVNNSIAQPPADTAPAGEEEETATSTETIVPAEATTPTSTGSETPAIEELVVTEESVEPAVESGENSGPEEPPAEPVNTEI